MATAASAHSLPKQTHVNVHKPPAGVTPGIHTPDVPYAPSNPLAWGPKGEWGPKKGDEAQKYEAQYAATMSYQNQEGFISDQYTWEARGKQEEATFRPNPRNIAPRKPDWKPETPISY